MNMNDLEMMFSPRGPSTPKRRRMVPSGYAGGGSASKTTAGPRFSTPVRKHGPAAPSPSALLAGMGSNLFPGTAVPRQSRERRTSR